MNTKEAPMSPITLAGQIVTLNVDLLDLKGRPHPYAGKQVTILNKTRQTYIADPGDGSTTVFHDGAFTLPPELEGTPLIHIAGVGSEIITAPWGMLIESPLQPRKTFNAGKLTELSKSIKRSGILQALLVRPIVVDGVVFYEIVFGHRRYRAAGMAGLAEVPVMVRTLTDAQVRCYQAIENLQREDLNPIEEAQGYADYCRAEKISKQKLADFIGVSRTTVYNQLKLLELCAEGQDLVQRGVLGTELAVQVARVGAAEAQAPVLKRIFYGADLATATTETKAMSLRQGITLLESIENPKKPSTMPPAASTKSAKFDFLKHLIRQREFSEKTFGPGPRTAGVVDHIRKELREIEANPSDLSEWIDVAILALDGAWRAGGSPQQIINTLVGKQTKNEARAWPDWRTAPADQAIEHDRSSERATA
jgi:ParB/RepB/Spo0J family partition protein